jgi:hypothetical protein
MKTLSWSRLRGDVVSGDVVSGDVVLGDVVLMGQRDVVLMDGTADDGRYHSTIK